MMGRLSLLALLLLAGSVPPPAAAEGATTFSGRASLCHWTYIIQVELADCPRASHEGTLTILDCAAEACNVLVTVQSAGAGLPHLRKTLVASLVAPGEVLTSVCSAVADGAAVSCEGQGAASVTVAVGECADLRVRTLMRELSGVGPSIPVQADNAFRLCRTGAGLAVG